MRICFSMDPLTIDPRKNGDSITSALHYMIFDGLVRINSLGGFELALAESYEILDNGKTYEFTLRDAYWSNGDPILAQDFENSWKRSLNPAFPVPSPQIFFFLRNAEKARNGLVDFSEVGVKAIGPKKLKIELENSCPHLFSLLSLCNLFPAPNLLENSLDWIDSSRIPISGPFQIISWKKREEIRLQKNPLYWDEKNVSLSELIIYICQNPYNILKMFNDRQIDLLSNVYCSLPVEMLKEYENQDLVQLTSLGATVFCSFNNSTFPFNNKNIRKAFSFAIDRKEISSSFEIPAERFLPPPFSKGIPKTPISCNIGKARYYLKLGMKELGVFEDGDQVKLRMFFDKMILHFENSISRTRIARTLQKQWKECLGIQVQLEPLNYQKQVTKFYENDYSMAIGHWIPQYLDPVSILERFKDRVFLKNYPRFEDPKYCKIINKINKTSDHPLRDGYILEAERLLTEEVPLTPLYHYNHVTANRSEFKGISFLPNGLLSFTACSSDLMNETITQCSYG